jgi:hypothetical protein
VPDAGTAAALAARVGVDPSTIPFNATLLWSLQQQLIRDDAYVIAVTNEDPRDYARFATVSASSEQRVNASNPFDGDARNVISGQTRAVVFNLTSSSQIGGVGPNQGIPGTNRWMSDGPFAVCARWLGWVSV